MSENNKPMELSTEDLDTIAGGATSVVDADVFNSSDEQASLLNIGADGGIQSAQVQKTTVSKQSLEEIKVTGDIPGIPAGFFGA